MLLPGLNIIGTRKDMVMEFKGYNHNLYVPQNQFYDMKNMTSSFYPVLSPRGARGILGSITKPNGLFAKNKLAWVDGTDFYYNGVKRGTITDSEKQFIGMGAYILIFPDKKYFNTETNEFGNLGNKVVTSTTLTYTLAKADGTDYGAYTVSPTEPSNPVDNQLWVDTSETPNILKQYSSYTGAWVQVPTTYVKISATGINTGFKKGDGITISGSTNSNFNTNAIIQAIGTNYIVIVGILSATFNQSTALTIERKIPDMEYLTESENRVWGCNSHKHEIYSCKLGDPFNWNVFQGISTDSYAVTVGTDGDFTGAITHMGYVLFFKENCIHRIMGNKPSNFQITNTNVRGVEKGSSNSLVIVNETLYYKSRNDVCAYSGSLPVSISDVLGHEYYSNAVAGTVGNKYYISMKDTTNTWHLFVYDEKTGLWHKEDNTHVKQFARLGNELYFVAADSKLYSVNGSLSIEEGGANFSELSTKESNFEWHAESGDLGVESPDTKYISKIQIRLDIDENSKLQIALQYNSDGMWHEKYVISATRKKSITVPIIPNRCDHMKIRISGTGNCKVFSLSKVYEKGSEI